ncbi:MAG: aminopeptidase P N-terminal domain-containing protein [Campylobacterales bacterium]|nr:aminopeptidase P N-terminal domain-containing protein [Campylobacterales bacterium]
MIEEKEYKARREKLIEKLDEHSISILFSAEPKSRSNDTEYPYRQNSNFYYLTGFKEDSAAIVIVKKKSKAKTYLFVAKKEPALELWTGKRLGVEGAKEIFSFDEVFEYETLQTFFRENIVEKQTLYYDFSHNCEAHNSIVSLCKNFYAYKNLAKKIAKARLIKSSAEIAIIRKALSITQEAHHRAMSVVPKLQYEYELQAEIEYIFKKNGAYSDAYTSIVASGNAANTLHYISNDKAIKKGELLLIDAGCEYDYYSSDITRTIPADGLFSQAQKELYSLVLDVEKEIISMIKPGVMRSALHTKSEELLCEGMVRLGILKGKVKKLLKEKKHKAFYPHGIGHWMGLDVHDEALYKNKKAKEIPLQEGMVLTIEPGIYLDEENETVPQKYKGIGIRIEDDILVTSQGCENLSKNIMKEIKDIESLGKKK